MNKKAKRGLLIGLCSAGGVLAIAGAVVAITLVSLNNILSDWELDLGMDDAGEIQHDDGDVDKVKDEVRTTEN